MQTNEKNIVEQVADVADVVTSAVVKKKWTIKRVMLYVVTLYFVFLILKFVFKVIFKVLDLFRAYIHDLTDRHKMSEVFLWTLAGVISGVLLHKQIIDIWQNITDFFNNIFLPWVINL